MASCLSAGVEVRSRPLLYPATTDLNITFAFALVAFVTIEVAGVLILGVAASPTLGVALVAFRRSFLVGDGGEA